MSYFLPSDSGSHSLFTHRRYFFYFCSLTLDTFIKYTLSVLRIDDSMHPIFSATFWLAYTDFCSFCEPDGNMKRASFQSILSIKNVRPMLGSFLPPAPCKARVISTLLSSTHFPPSLSPTRITNTPDWHLLRTIRDSSSWKINKRTVPVRTNSLRLKLKKIYRKAGCIEDDCDRVVPFEGLLFILWVYIIPFSFRFIFRWQLYSNK